MTVDRDGECLLIYPLSDWEQIERKLMELPSLHPQARRLQRLMVGYATELDARRPWRMLLPQELREFAGSSAHAMLIGQGNRAASCGTRRAGMSGAIGWLKSEARLDELPPSSSQSVALRQVRNDGGRRQLDEHTPVLVEEALRLWRCGRPGLYVDATFGRGGHSARILAALGPEGRLIAIDRDPEAIAAGRRALCSTSRDLRSCTPVRSTRARLAARQASPAACDGILFDLGVSSPQLEDPRAVSASVHDGPLDMRMDPTRGEPVSAGSRGRAARRCAT